MSDWRKTEKRQRTVIVGLRFTPDEHAAALSKVPAGESLQSAIRAAFCAPSIRKSGAVLGDNEGGATGTPIPAAPDRTPLGKQEAG